MVVSKRGRLQVTVKEWERYTIGIRNVGKVDLKQYLVIFSRVEPCDELLGPDDFVGSTTG